MLCMFMGGCIDLVRRPIRGELEWLKNLSISTGMLRRFNLSMVIALDGAHVRYVGYCVCSWGAKCTDLPGSLALVLGYVHTLDVVYLRGGEVH